MRLKVWRWTRPATRTAGIATAAVVLVLGVVPQSSAHAIPSPITATVNTTPCPTRPPVLVNGGFEDFSNPATDATVQTGTFNISGWWGTSAYSYGWWHGYGNGPDQILFLNSAATSGVNLQPGKTANAVTGWKSTSPMIELQRQVDSYSVSHDDAFNAVTITPARSGIASASTTGAPGYFDLYGPQPAEGGYWAELNAVENSALYQDIQVPATAQLFWALKHRGRSDSSEVMRVLIGDKAVGSSAVMSDPALSPQTALQKFSPTNPDKYLGVPTYSATSTPVSTISDKLSEGWSMYMGTVDPLSGATATSPLRNVRFQFESVTGANGGAYPTVGNLLDDISFTPFFACPVVRTLYAGQTSTVDVTGSDGGVGTKISYGVGHSLSAIGNLTGGATTSDFSQTGNAVSFTPRAAGTYTVDYQTQMTFAGAPYAAASQITYNVLASPLVSFDPNGGPGSISTATVTYGSNLGTITFPVPSRPGYTFDGWFTSATGGALVDATAAASMTMTADQTLYAHWTVIPAPPAAPSTTAAVLTTSASAPTDGLALAGVNVSGMLLAVVFVAGGGVLLLIRRERRNRGLTKSQHSRGIPGDSRP